MQSPQLGTYPFHKANCPRHRWVSSSRFPSSMLASFRIVIIGKEAEPTKLNVAILICTGLLWSGICLIFRLWPSQNKQMPCYSNERLPNIWLLTLMGLGVGLFTAWLIQSMMNDETQALLQVIEIISIVPGFCLLLLPNPFHSSSHGPLILEAFSNRFGLFHIILSGQERLGQSWEGHTLSELDLRKKNLLVLAIIRGEEIIPFPKGPEMLRRFDDLLIFGSMNELGITEMPK